MNQSDKILRTSPLPAILRGLYPNFSYCQKCGLPWSCCISKSVKTSDYNGTFATCDICWENSTLNELKEYYEKTYNEQVKSLIDTKHKMNHTLEHLLKCVEKEYNNTHKNEI